MSEELREEIRNNLNLKDIYKLLEIWKTNNRTEWSDTTFEVLREILKERIGEIPPQDPPIIEQENDGKDSDGLEDWEAQLIDNKDQPEFYDPLEVISLKRNIDKLVIVVAIVYILLALLNFQFVRALFEGTAIPLSSIRVLSPDVLITMISALLQIGLTYFPLKALTHILRILMEMEFNSRKTK
jgi:hypothetical protein